VIDKDEIIQHIDEGNVALDPTSAADACNILRTRKQRSGCRTACGSKRVMLLEKKQ